MISFFKRHLWLAPTLIFAFFLAIGLNLHPLWSDEAETAFFAKSILGRGLPYAFDGTNLTSIANGVTLDKNLLNHLNPWLQFYLTAGSFKLFGISSLIARLPFALIAIFIIPLVFRISLELSGKRLTAFLAGLVAALSVPLILFSQQCRYYTLSMVFGLSFFWSAINLDFSKRWPKIVFVLSLALGLYTHYISVFFLYSSFFLVLLTRYLLNKEIPKKIVRFIAWYLALGIAGALFFVPWFYLLKPYESPTGVVISTFIQFIQALPIWFYLACRYFNNANVFPILFLPILLIILIRRGRSGWARGIRLMTAAIFMYLLLVAAVSAFMLTSSTFFTEVRYNLVLFPLFFILDAMLLTELFYWKKAVFVAFLTLFVLTNLFTLKPFRSFLVEYLGEVTNPYPTSNQLIADYLNAYAKDGETVFVNSDRAHDPLMFLIKKNLRFINRIIPDNPIISGPGRKDLPRYLYSYLLPPDWVILYSNHRMNKAYYDFDIRGNYPWGLPPSADLRSGYTETVLPVFYGSDNSRPEIEVHQFSKIIPKYDEQIFIYHKK